MRAREPGLVVLVSDLLDPQGFEAGVRALRGRGFEVHVVHLLDAEELNPTLGGDLRLHDSETGEVRELTVDGDALRAYRERLHVFRERVEAFCRTQEIGYRRASTDTPFEEFVLSHLRGLVLAWGAGHELSLASGVRGLRALTPPGPALFPEGPAARAHGSEPAPVGSLAPRSGGLGLLPAVAA